MTSNAAAAVRPRLFVLWLLLLLLLGHAAAQHLNRQQDEDPWKVCVPHTSSLIHPTSCKIASQPASREDNSTCPSPDARCAC